MSTLYAGIPSVYLHQNFFKYEHRKRIIVSVYHYFVKFLVGYYNVLDCALPVAELQQYAYCFSKQELVVAVSRMPSNDATDVELPVFRICDVA